MSLVQRSNGKPKALPYAQRCFAGTLAMLLDGSLSPPEREHAAFVARYVARHVIFDERLATDVMRVIAIRLEEPSVVNALVHVLRRCADRGKLAAGLQRLAFAARQDGHWEAFVIITYEMQEIREWRSHITDDWFAECMHHVVRQERLWIAAGLVSNRLQGHDIVPDHLRDLVQQYPALLGIRPLASSEAWQLHQACPTPQGWRVLATEPTRRDYVAAPGEFGSELDVAIETLEAAIGKEDVSQTRTILTRWLHELGGNAGESS